MNLPDTWVEDLINDASKIFEDGVKQWAEVIHTLGTPRAIRTEWCTTYLRELRNLLSELHNDLKEREAAMVTTITELTNEVSEAASELGIPDPTHSEVNLYDIEKWLRDNLLDLQKQIKRKREEVTLLMERQEKVCSILGRTPKVLLDKPLPGPVELESFLLYIESLEEECFTREETFASTQCQLQQLADDYDYEPVDEFEIQIIRNTESPFVVSDNNMKQLTTFQRSLKQYANDINTEVGDFKDQLIQLWLILETDGKYIDAFLKSHSNYKKPTICAIKSEIKRLQDLKNANIGMLCTKLQKKLVEQWDLCHYTQRQRQKFDAIDDNAYTESMLTDLQNEVAKISQIYEDNKPLYESLLKYYLTWKRVDELEAPDLSQNRLKNRGGRLLIEEKERKTAKKRLEKLAQLIIKQADDYFLANNKQFIYEGVTVEEYFRSLEAKDEQKLLSYTSKFNICGKPSSPVENCRTTTKVVKPLIRRLQQTTKNDETPQSMDSRTSEKTAFAIPKAKNTILSRKCAPVNKLKDRSKHMMSLQQDKLEDHVTMIQNYRRFQNIADTSMPRLINNTSPAHDCSLNKSSTEQHGKENELSYTSTSESDLQFDSDASCMPSSYYNSFDNITKRKRF